MTTADSASRPALRSQRLNQITNEPHQKLDALVKAHKPFDDVASFARFVVAQYLFQSELKALYTDPALKQIVPDLARALPRRRKPRLDLADLEHRSACPRGRRRADSPSKAEALGWLFVSEGSKLGAAFLIKRAVGLGLSDTFGARHLGEPAGGRAEGWKRFTRTLDGLELTAEEEAGGGQRCSSDAFVALHRVAGTRLR
jgi:heme oxygenase (biliverdin-IX-beta and delta-forming)